MKIREGKLDGFKRQAAVCISQVKEKDPGTLQYDWFLNSDKTRLTATFRNCSFEYLDRYNFLNRDWSGDTETAAVLMSNFRI